MKKYYGSGSKKTKPNKANLLKVRLNGAIVQNKANFKKA